MSASFRVVGYLPDYTYGGTAGKLNWGALTQIDYFSVVPSGTTGLMPGTTNGPAAKSSSGFALSQLSAAAASAHTHGVKINIVVGGAGLDSTIPTIAASASLRNTFADSVQAFCAKYHLDGVDLDWEPTAPTAQQVINYGNLIHALRMRTSGLQLSAAVNPDKLPEGNSSKTEYVLNAQAVKDLDLIGVMTYDLEFNSVAPTQESETDMQAWIKYLAANSASNSKLLFGLPFYGRAGTSWDNSQAQTYNDIVNSYISQTGKSPAASTDALTVSFADAFDGKTVAWGFNGPATIAAKTNYAISNGMGGVMIWNLGQDHFDAKGHYDKYSLLPAVASAVSSHTASISGAVFNDTNHNGARNKGETGLAGWTVYIDANNNGRLDAGELTTATTSSGNYAFLRLFAGSYVIRVSQKSGWSQTLPASSAPRKVTAAAGKSYTAEDFGQRH